MKREWIIAVLLLFVEGVLCSPLLCRADHAAGGELTYEWVSDSTYRFYFKFYRDCSGVVAPANVRMCMFNTCGYNSSILLLPVTNLPDGPNGHVITQTCPNVTTRCSGGNFPGYQEWWYSATLRLPARCNYWTFYTVVDNRNNSNNVAWGNLYVEATLNNADGQGNSSPWFSVKPVSFVCINNPYTYNNGTIDPDNDSLAFEMINPRTASVACQPSYTATNLTLGGGINLTNNPLYTGNTFSLSGSNGQMSFTASNIGAATISMRVNEYRNGIKIGSVMRDIQLNVISCTVPPPVFAFDTASVSGGQLVNGMLTGCTNHTLRFCYTLRSAQPGARLIASDNHASSVPTAGVSYSGQQTGLVTGCFTWTPTALDTGFRIFAVTVKDSSCTGTTGVIISQTYTIPVYIYPGVKVFSDAAICRGDSVQLHATGGPGFTWSVVPGGAPPASLSCSSCSDPVARPDVSTRYVAVSVRPSGTVCSNKDTVTVSIDNGNTLAITPPDPVILCRPDSLHLDADITGPKPLQQLSCGRTGTAGTNIVDSTELVLPYAGILNNNNPSSTPFSGSYVTARHQYLIRAADLRASGMRSGTLKAVEFGVPPHSGNIYYNNVKVFVKCTTLDSLQAGRMESGMEQVFAAVVPFSIPAAGGWVRFDFSALYNWDITQNLIVEVCYANNTTVAPVYTYYYPANYRSYAGVYSMSGTVCGGSAGSGSLSGYELPQMRFMLYRAPETDFAYTWSNGIFYPDAHTKDPVVFVSGTRDYYVSAYSSNGCLLTDTAAVYLSARSPVVTPEDTAICSGSRLLLKAGGGAQYAWYEDGFMPPATLSCGDCSTPVATPPADITYMVVIADSLRCADTLQATVRVNPLPAVHVLTPDTVIRYGEQVRLEAAAGSRYRWSPARGLDNPGAADPVARPQEPTRYVVSGTDENGCTGTDSVFVDIDYRNNIFIPTAFTPNGDGRNDLFHIAHLRFEQLTEFRIFNRWGEEVFSTTDGAKGWDGTYKGEPQNTGVYYYTISMSLPDGTTAAYKGSVTLVR